MSNILALASLAEPVAFDSARQNDSWTVFVLGGHLIGVVHLDWIVPAERELLQLLVRQVLHHVEQPRIDAPEVLADVGARLDGVFLILTVDDLAHPFHQDAVAIFGQ